MELITKLSGLLKAITYTYSTIRVMCWLFIKFNLEIKWSRYE